MNIKRLLQRQNRHHSRKIHYIDHQLQKWLLISLVVMQVTLLCIAGAVLYYRLNTIVDENLYRIHFSDQPSMFSILLKESLLIMAGLVATNLIAVLVADRIWSRHVNDLMISLRELLSRTSDLDLRPDDEVQVQHPVLVVARAWRELERARNKAIRNIINRLEGIANTRPVVLDEFHQCLISLSEQLPSSSTVKSNQHNLTAEAVSNASMVDKH